MLCLSSFRITCFMRYNFSLGSSVMVWTVDENPRIVARLLHNEVVTCMTPVYRRPGSFRGGTDRMHDYGSLAVGTEDGHVAVWNLDIPFGQCQSQLDCKWKKWYNQWYVRLESSCILSCFETSSILK